MVDETRFLVTMRDVTELMNEQRIKMRQQSNLLDRLFETSRDALMLCELPAAPEQPPTVLRRSASTHSVLGVPADANPFTAFTEQQRAIDKDVGCLREDGFFPERTTTLVHSGTILACSGHMVDEARFLVTMRDVTELKAAEAARQAAAVERERVRMEEIAAANAKAEKALLDLLDDGPDLVSQVEIKDSVATRVWSSRSHEAILGHPAQDCTGDVMKLTNLYAADFLERDLPDLIAAFQNGCLPDGACGEDQLLHSDGRRLCFEWRMKICRGLPGRITVISRDITDRKERQRLEVRDYVTSYRR